MLSDIKNIFGKYDDATGDYKRLIAEIVTYLSTEGEFLWRIYFTPIIGQINEVAANQLADRLGYFVEYASDVTEHWFTVAMDDFVQISIDTIKNGLQYIYDKAKKEQLSDGEVEQLISNAFATWISGVNYFDNALKAGKKKPSKAMKAVMAQNIFHKQQNEKVFELLKKIGVTWKKWYTNEDGHERHTHNVANGQVRYLSGEFKVGGYAMQYPHDQSLGAPAKEVVNCRCIMKEATDDEAGAYLDAIAAQGQQIAPPVLKPVQYPPDYIQQPSSSIAAQSISTNGDKTPDGRLYSNVDDPIAYEKEWKGKIANLTPEQRSSVTTYTGSEYQQINGDLRTGAVRTELRDTVKNMDKAMNATTIGQDIIVNRGSSSLSYLGIPDGASLAKAKKTIGTSFTDQGYTSTSVKRGFGGHKLIIEVPSETHGIYVREISSWTDENEVLLARGTTFEILDVEVGEIGATGRKSFNIRLRVTGQKDTSGGID